MVPTRLIVDTDTAGDDVNSLLIALLHPAIRLEAVTISVGNVGFEQQIENALYTIEMAGRSGEVPVYPGCAEPLLQRWVAADYVHGREGMGDSFFPKARQRPESRHAVDALIERVQAEPGRISILAQAPLTNIAAAVIRDPSIATRVERLYIMGGTYFAPGNITPAAEYNFYVDPEAAAIVFNAGFPIRLVDWGVCVRDGVLGDADLAEIEALGTELSRFYLAVNRLVRRFNESVGIPGVTHPDSIVAAMIADPDIALGWRRCHVDIETRGELTRGASVILPESHAGVERRDVARFNAEVCLGVDTARFKALLLEILSRR
ncbi:MAG TPA: nucleoside hydrolase [Bacillota bacterium]